MTSNSARIYLPKFATVRAVQWDGENFEEVRKLTINARISNGQLFHHKNPITIGDYIVADQYAEVYSCPEEVFLNEYDPEPQRTIKIVIPDVGTSCLCDNCYKSVVVALGREVAVLTITNFFLKPCDLCAAPGKQEFHITQAKIAEISQSADDDTLTP